jgi:hypothetical protein
MTDPAPAIRRAAAAVRPPVEHYAQYIRGPPVSLRALNRLPSFISRSCPTGWLRARPSRPETPVNEELSNEPDCK